MSAGRVRRLLDERNSRCLATLLAALACSVVVPGPALAEWRPAGAITAGMLVQSSSATGGPALGGGLAADLWQSFGALRLGFYMGLDAMTGEPEDAMVFTPIAFSGAVVLESRKVSFEIRIRGGGFAGAVHDHGFVGGLYLGTGVFLDIAISDQALIGFGGDLHLLVASERSSVFDSRAFFAPGITLVYRPPISEEPAESSETAEPIEPSEPAENVESAEPSESTEPLGPNDSIEPSEPSESIGPIEPSEPSESTEPLDPSEPSEPLVPPATDAR